MENGFSKADSSMNSFMVAGFFANNSDFCTAEFRNVKKLMNILDGEQPRKNGKFMPIPKNIRILDTKGYRCSFCREKFGSKTAYNKHKDQADCSFKQGAERLRKNNMNQEWTCKQCGEVFKTSTLLRRHRKTHIKYYLQQPKEPTHIYDERQDLFICEMCSAEFQSKEEVDVHLKTHKTEFKCKTCLKIFTQVNEFCLHTLQHKTVQKLTCPVCNIAFPNVSSFKRHARTEHFENLPFYCRVCGKGFSQKCLWLKHAENHDKTKKFECVVCQKTFGKQHAINLHQIRDHQVSSSGKLIGAKCELCFAYFKKQETYLKHRSSCTGRKVANSSHLCSDCGMTFSRNSNLKKHIRLHTGEKPFECTICKKRFVDAYKLTSHSRVHTGERPYACQYCGKRFGYNAPFRVHIRTHTGERPYVCDKCQKGFTTNQGLRLHIKNCVVPGFEMIMI